MANERVSFTSSKSIHEVINIISQKFPKYLCCENNIVYFIPWSSNFNKITVGCEILNNSNKYTLHLFYSREKIFGWQVVSFFAFILLPIFIAFFVWSSFLFMLLISCLIPILIGYLRRKKDTYIYGAYLDELEAFTKMYLED